MDRPLALLQHLVEHQAHALLIGAERIAAGRPIAHIPLFGHGGGAEHGEATGELGGKRRLLRQQQQQ
jgi:hypothetical protein